MEIGIIFYQSAHDPKGTQDDIEYIFTGDTRAVVEEKMQAQFKIFLQGYYKMRYDFNCTDLHSTYYGEFFTVKNDGRVIPV